MRFVRVASPVITVFLASCFFSKNKNTDSASTVDADLPLLSESTEGGQESDGNSILPGEKPSVAWESTQDYEIELGDTLSGIAAKFSVPVSLLKQANGLKNDRIYSGKNLKIPILASNEKPDESKEVVADSDPEPPSAPSSPSDDSPIIPLPQQKTSDSEDGFRPLAEPRSLDYGNAFGR